MDQIQVNIVSIHFSQAFQKGFLCLFIAMIIVMELGGKEYLLSSNSALSYCLSDARLITIRGCCIYMAIPYLESVANTLIGCFTIRYLLCAKSKLRNLKIVVHHLCLHKASC